MNVDFTDISLDENSDVIKEISKVLPAKGWYSLYHNEETGETDRYPLVCFAVVKISGRDVVVGMDAASAKCVEFCFEDDGFIGYEFLGN